MDPLHPAVPIQPTSPTPPDYTRVQRVARDQQREAAPDWQRSGDEHPEDEEREDQYEDDYDPHWSDTAAAEAYNDHGVLTEHPAADDPAPEVEPHRKRRPRGERRSAPRTADAPEDDNPGPHIDIIA